MGATKSKTQAKVKAKPRIRPHVEGLWKQAYKGGYRYLLKGRDEAGKMVFVTVPIEEMDSDTAYLAKVEEARKRLEAKIHPPMDIDYWLGVYILKRGLRAGSQYQYRHHLAGFSLDDAQNAKRVKEILRSGKSESSLKQIVGIINTFYKFLVNSGVQVKNPVVGLRVGKFHHRTRIPTEDEIKILMRWAESSIEDELFLRLILCTGARVSSIEVLRTGDLDADGHIHLYNVKAGKKYDYSILVTDARAVELWRRLARGKSASMPLFPDAVRTGRRVKWACYKMIPADQNGERISPHSFRHLYATRLVQQGVDLATVSRLLDHSSVATTLTYYARHSQDQLDEAVSRL